MDIVEFETQRLRSLRAMQAGLLELKLMRDVLRFDRALRDHVFALKFGYNPAQPRDEIGRWVDAGAGQVRLATSDIPQLGPKSKLAIAVVVARQAIKLFRDRNLLHDMFGVKEGTVTYTEINNAALYGINSDSPEYKDRDMIAAEQLRGELIAKYPHAMARENIGQMPNNAVFHAEATVLLRASKANGGTLAGKSLEVHVDRPMCYSCDRILPLVGLQLGDPTVTFIGPSGIAKTMRGGAWIK